MLVNPLLKLRTSETFIFDFKYLKGLHQNKDFLVKHIEDIFSLAGYPESDREKNNLIILEKVVPGYEYFKFTRTDKGFDVVRFTQTLGLWVIDSESKVLREVVYKNVNKRTKQLDRFRRPAKSVKIRGLSEKEIKNLGKKIFQEDFSFSNSDMIELFSLDKAKVFMEKPKKELSESFNNMPTQRMVTQYIVKTKGIMDPNKTFIQETNKEGYYFEWKFIKSDFVPSSDLESLNYLKRLDII